MACRETGTEPCIDEFFSVRVGALEHAVEECRHLTVPESDGAINGAWLLTEINHWDIEKERVVVLCERTLLVIKYDFIALRSLESTRINLTSLQNLQIGELTYPSHSLVPARNMQGFRLTWNNGHQISFAQKWNPWSRDIPTPPLPHTPLTGTQASCENGFYDAKSLSKELKLSLEQLQAQQDGPATGTISQRPIVIENYLGIASLLHNATETGLLQTSR
ncbi:Tumor protein p63-regulated 1-like protein [Chionoecetes opilio]|uniref:Tumor protein p63-regulated 1-like protein n=1 Tax=Chionoecetes opilio TaxID=41210 RepID=A0A8J4XX14_CHIOP|nr:Tumor protein p63-regulated 1-like protein [Chionoecetes opilio]